MLYHDPLPLKIKDDNCKNSTETMWLFYINSIYSSNKSIITHIACKNDFLISPCVMNCLGINSDCSVNNSTDSKYQIHQQAIKSHETIKKLKDITFNNFEYLLLDMS